MYCSNCGTQLPDDANFCLKCGKPQKQSVTAPSAPTQYEHCTIKLKSGFMMLKWEAWMGNSKIAQGAEFAENPFGDMVGQRREKNIEFISQLTSQGWEVLTSNEEGCVTAMRRPKR